MQKENQTRCNLKKRIFYSLAFIILFCVEVIIALFVKDALIRPYVGDMLVVIVIYCFLRIWIPEKSKLLPLYIFIFAVLVECLQYLRLVELLGLQNNTFFRTLLGSVFDSKDILCYGAGCILLFIYERFGVHKSK